MRLCTDSSFAPLCSVHNLLSLGRPSYRTKQGEMNVARFSFKENQAYLK